MFVGERMTNCRGCGRNIETEDNLIDLGDQSLTCFPLPGEPVPHAPLQLLKCPACDLLQSRWSVPPDLLYTWYGYRSGINESMVKALGEVVSGALSHLDISTHTPKTGRVVLDIGSNDGTLLRQYPEGFIRVGFEPAKNLREVASEGLDVLVPDFFSAKAYLDRVADRATIVTACAMFYDLTDPVGFLSEVHDILDDRGILVIQQNYLPAMLRGLTYDNVSHEHLCYFALTTLIEVLKRACLYPFDVVENDVNGGSFRVYCAKKGSGIKNASGRGRIEKMLVSEFEMRLRDDAIYKEFNRKIERSAISAYYLLESLVAAGKKIYVYGASTRGLVTVHKMGVRPGMVLGAAERNPEKFGRLYSSTGIVCVDEETARKDADYFLVLPYQFISSFLEREKEFIGRGGRLLTIVPRPRIWMGTWRGAGESAPGESAFSGVASFEF